MNAKPHATTPFRRSTLALALGLALLAPAAAAQDDPFALEEPTAKPDTDTLAELTQIDNWLEIGAILVSDDSFKFGRYSGLVRDGGYGVLSFSYLQRGRYDDPSAAYCRIEARDLGLDSRRARVEVGVQGDYRVSLSYRQIPNFRSDTAQTIFTRPGDSHLTLPSNWVGAQNTAGMTNLLANLRPVDLKTERRAVGGSVLKEFAEKWQFVTEVRHETKDGLKSIGAVIGNSGGNPRAVLLPEPIDYEVTDFSAALRYVAKRWQAELRYSGQWFDDHNAALSWQNPYRSINGWTSTAGFPTGIGQMSLPPDNQFHQFAADVAWQWNDRTRLSADVARGRLTQNDAFLPYTVDPTAAASITVPLPRDSLDGEIITTVANLRIASRPNAAFNWSVGWRYDDRDNNTPRSEYVYIGGDSNTQNTAATSSFRRYNEPYSYRENQWRADAGYRFEAGTRLAFNAQRREIERSYTERERADEDSVGLVVSHAIEDWLNVRVGATWADRSGSTYQGNEPFLSGYAPGYTSTVPGQFENPPDLRRFYEADRRRHQGSLAASVTPTETLSLELEARFGDDDYRHSALGLTGSRWTAYTVGGAWQPTSAWQAHAEYTHEFNAADQAGQSTSGATRVADAANPARHWVALHRDAIDTGSAGIEWKGLDGRLTLGLDDLVALSNDDIRVTAGSALAYAPLPNNKTRLDSLSLHARYRMHARWFADLRWRHERYRSSDWALDGNEANQLANVILFGETSPDYRVNAVALTFTYHF